MSYTYPHYISQSPAASFQGAHSLTHYMEEQFGPRQPHISENDLDGDDHDFHESVRRGIQAPTRTYGSIPRRGSVASLGHGLTSEHAPLLINKTPLSASGATEAVEQRPGEAGDVVDADITAQDLTGLPGPDPIQEAIVLVRYAVPILM